MLWLAIYSIFGTVLWVFIMNNTTKGVNWKMVLVSIICGPVGIFATLAYMLYMILNALAKIIAKWIQK